MACQFRREVGLTAVKQVRQERKRYRDLVLSASRDTDKYVTRVRRLRYNCPRFPQLVQPERISELLI